MKFLSAKSALTDPYRAGFEIGISLSAISPEVVLLFASMSYNPGFADFFTALYDALGNEQVIIFGGTGDGIYETSGAANYGVTALGINSGEKVAWSVALEQGVLSDSFAAARACARKAIELDRAAPCFRMVLADGAKADGEAVVKGVSSLVSDVFFGGLTGDDRKFTSSRVFLNGKEYEDAVAMLTGSGQMNFAVNAASGWSPMGAEGVVGDTEKSMIRTISGMPAQEFMARETGKPLAESDLGVVPLAAYLDGSTDHFYLRTPSQLHTECGAISTFGSVETGTVVRVCGASQEDILKGAENSLDRLDEKSLGFTPAAAIVISCAGRKWLMSDRGDKELTALKRRLGDSIPLVGFPSFGEISPFRLDCGSYTPVRFHNVTFVVCLIG